MILGLPVELLILGLSLEFWAVISPYRCRETVSLYGGDHDYYLCHIFIALAIFIDIVQHIVKMIGIILIIMIITMDICTHL